jgi:outer membrane protein TolC
MKKYWIFLLLLSWTARSQTDSLNHYLQMAARNNPAVKAAFHNYEAALQKIPQAGALEDLRLDMGFFLQPMELLEGRQIAQVQLMQMFPWFGTRKAARTEAQHMAQMTFEQFRETKDNLYLEIYSRWYNLCALKQKLSNNTANRALLRQLEELALRRFTAAATPSLSEGTTSPSESPKPSGSTSGAMSMNNPSMSSATANKAGAAMSMRGTGTLPMGNTPSGLSEVLRIQLEIAEQDSNHESLLSELAAGKAHFNTLINRPTNSEVILPDTFPQTHFPASIESLAAAIETQNPMLAMLQAEALAYQSQETMIRKMSYPMFGIGLQYMVIGEKKGMDTHSSVSMNGKDMLMPMLSLSLPIYRNRHRAARKEVQLLQSANREKQTDLLHRLQAELWQRKHQLDESARRITLYKKQSVLTQTTYDLSLKEFTSGRATLSDVLQIQRQLLDYQLKTAEATAEHHTAVAGIQQILSQWQ